MRLKNYIEELKKRNVIKAALAYLVVAWLIIQVASIVLPAFEAPKYILKTILLILGIGFPIWLIFSWTYDITSEGLVKTSYNAPDDVSKLKTKNRLNIVIISALSVTVLLLLFNPNRGGGNMQEVTELSNSGEITVAVLAFEDMSPQKDQEYWSDGMSTEIISLLGKMKDISVRAKRSSFYFKGKNSTITQIASELNVTHIIDGSVRTHENKVRIDIQLINVLDGSTIWLDTFDGDIDKVLKMQNDIALQVRDQLELKLLNDVETKPNVNPTAYKLYLEADFIFFQNDDETILKAIDLLRKSIEIDPTNPQAYTLLSRALLVAGVNYQSILFSEAISESKLMAEKAVSLDRNSGSAYAMLARISLTERLDFDTANKFIDMAYEASPNNTFVLASKQLVRGYSGNLDNLEENYKRIIEISPKENSYYRNIGIGYHWLGEWDKSIENLLKYNNFYPDETIGNALLARVYMDNGDLENALKYAKNVTNEFWKLYTNSIVFYSLGRIEDSNEMLQTFINTIEEDAWANVAVIYAYRNDKENVFKCLNKAFQQEPADLIEVINYPAFKAVYDDPRWKSLILKMNLPKRHRILKTFN